MEPALDFVREDRGSEHHEGCFANSPSKLGWSDLEQSYGATRDDFIKYLRWPHLSGSTSATTWRRGSTV